MQDNGGTRFGNDRRKFQYTIIFRKNGRVGTVEKVLIVEVRHHEEEGPSAGLV